MIFRESAKVLENIADMDSTSDIVKKTEKGTYSYTSKVVNKFKEEKLVKFQQDGRKKVILLTEKGRKARNKLRELRKILNEDSDSSD